MNAPAQSPEYRTRRAALWALYGVDLLGADPDDLLLYGYALMTEIDESLTDVWAEIEEMVFGVDAEQDRLNDEIQALSKRWRLDRMATIDRNILRLGAWALLGRHGHPLRVINDCIELAKEYGERGTPAFINGMLDQLCKNHRITVR